MVSLPNFCGFFSLAFVFCTLTDSKHALKDAIVGETFRREKARAGRAAILILKVRFTRWSRSATKQTVETHLWR